MVLNAELRCPAGGRALSSHGEETLSFRSDCEADKLKTLCTEGGPLCSERQNHFPRLIRGFTFTAISLPAAQLARGLGLAEATSWPLDCQPWHGASCPGLPSAQKQLLGALHPSSLCLRPRGQSLDPSQG